MRIAAILKLSNYAFSLESLRDAGEAKRCFDIFITSQHQCKRRRFILQCAVKSETDRRCRQLNCILFDSIKFESILSGRACNWHQHNCFQNIFEMLLIAVIMEWTRNQKDANFVNWVKNGLIKAHCVDKEHEWASIVYELVEHLEALSLEATSPTHAYLKTFHRGSSEKEYF